MVTADSALLKKIKIRTGRKINTLFVGEYHSAFRGFGLSFDSVREYDYGDDIRNVDWNVTARMNHPYIKEYIEERELSVVLMIDVSGSTDFGGERKKSDVVLEIAALFLYLSQMNNDRVSVILFSGGVEKFIRPKKGRKFILKVMDEIARCRPADRRTDIGAAVDFARRVLKKRSVIFLISDFIDGRKDYKLKLRLLGEKHDIIPVQVSDPMEKAMRIFGLAEFADLETGESFLYDMIPEEGAFPVLADFDAIHVSTSEPIEIPILRFFEKRNRTRLVRRDQG
ncbi:MAG: DUF58 domain-containing protein [Spirochaetes bacterium]|nr:DUF58 domain-containing protein [Spirochaetota bacterium]